MENYYICKFCGEKIKRGNPHHIKKCNGFKQFVNNNKDIVYDLYYNLGQSMVDISKSLDISYSQALSMFNILGYPTRTIKESKAQKHCKEKYENTMLKNWGTKHNFDRNCKSRQDWEKRLLETEGIVNVGQRESVKKKIADRLSKYSEEERKNNYTKGSTLEYWLEKLGEVEGFKRYNEICYNKGKSNRLEHYISIYGEDKGTEIYKKRIHDNVTKIAKGYHTSINEGLKNILDENNICYEREFPIQRIDENNRFFSYDFLIENKLIVEMNGRFWHADPRWYKETDILNFPGRKMVAKDVWERDNNKKNLAISKGYRFITIWEDDFNNSDKNEILKLIQNEISKN